MPELERKVAMIIVAPVCCISVTCSRCRDAKHTRVEVYLSMSRQNVSVMQSIPRPLKTIYNVARSRYRLRVEAATEHRCPARRYNETKETIEQMQMTLNTHPLALWPLACTYSLPPGTPTARPI